MSTSPASSSHAPPDAFATERGAAGPALSGHPEGTEPMIRTLLITVTLGVSALGGIAAVGVATQSPATAAGAR